MAINLAFNGGQRSLLEGNHGTEVNDRIGASEPNTQLRGGQTEEAALVKQLLSTRSANTSLPASHSPFYKLLKLLRQSAVLTRPCDHDSVRAPRRGLFGSASATYFGR